MIYGNRRDGNREKDREFGQGGGIIITVVAVVIVQIIHRRTRGVVERSVFSLLFFFPREINTWISVSDALFFHPTDGKTARGVSASGFGDLVSASER